VARLETVLLGEQEANSKCKGRSGKCERAEVRTTASYFSPAPSSPFVLRASPFLPRRFLLQTWMSRRVGIQGDHAIVWGSGPDSRGDASEPVQHAPKSWRDGAWECGVCRKIQNPGQFGPTDESSQFLCEVSLFDTQHDSRAFVEEAIPPETGSIQNCGVYDHFPIGVQMQKVQGLGRKVRAIEHLRAHCLPSHDGTHRLDISSLQVQVEDKVTLEFTEDSGKLGNRLIIRLPGGQVANPKSNDLIECEVLDWSQSREAGIVPKNRHPVSRRSYIQLDDLASALNGRSDSRNRVLGNIAGRPSMTDPQGFGASGAGGEDQQQTPGKPVPLQSRAPLCRSINRVRAGRVSISEVAWAKVSQPK
jgi:hypothetical protein